MVTKNFLVGERHCACKTFSLGQRTGIFTWQKGTIFAKPFLCDKGQVAVYHFPLTESNCAHMTFSLWWWCISFPQWKALVLITFSLQQRAGSSVSFSLDRKQLCLHNIFSVTKGRWQCSQKVEGRMVTVELCGTRWGGKCKGSLQDALRPLIYTKVCLDKKCRHCRCIEDAVKSL